jgi:DNA primase
MSYGRIPEPVIEAVLKHHDIVDVVGKYVHLSKQGHYMKGLCPFHSEKTPSFTVTPEKQIYHCYGCHAGGDAIRFLMEIESLSFSEAVRQMAEDAGIAAGWDDPGEEKTQEQLDKETLYEAYEQAAKWYHHILLNTEQGKPAMDYMRDRGISDKWIEFFQIGYAPAMWDKLAQFLQIKQFPLPLMERGGLISAKTDGQGYLDKFRDRVLFPIRDARGRTIAFAGRALGDIQPKYMNSPESMLFNKSRSLFHFHEARVHIRKSRQAILFEGYMDLIKAWEAGVHNGVATMGTALTEDHAAILKRNADQALVCYDGDSAGQTAAYKSIAILEKAGLHVKIARLPNGMDPDEFITAKGAERFQAEILDNAVPSVKYKLLYIRKNFKLQDVDERLRYIDTAVKIIGELPAPVEREHYLKELAEEFQYSLENLNQQLNLARQEFLKKKDIRDNNEISWNNVMNNGKAGGNRTRKTPTVQPAYHIAEMKLLAAMFEDREIADDVRERLGESFNIEAHAALAAYLYAFYAQGNEPDVSRYMSTLQDSKLESAASAILMQEGGHGVNPQVIDDYIREILKIPQQKAIEQKEQEMIRAQRSGENLLAAKLGNEIITLKKQLKIF